MEEEPAAGDIFRAYMLDNISASPCLDVDMDGALWRFLPEDVLEKVVLTLPARTQARFRSVSKNWLFRLTSAEFRKRSGALAFSSGRHICGIVHKGLGGPWEENEDVLGASSRYKVHELSLGFIPKEFQHIRKKYFMIQWGLIALETEFPEDYKLCLVNPVNRTWKVLEHPGCPPGSSARAISLFACAGDSGDGGSGCSYKALVYCAEPYRTETMERTAWYSSRKFMVYCSSTDAWTAATLDFGLGEILLESCWVYARLLENKSTSLEDVKTSRPCTARRGRMWVPVEGHGAGYFLVTSVGTIPGRRFEIWKLNETSKEWESIAVLPDDIMARMLLPDQVQGGEVEEEEEDDNNFRDSSIVVSAQLVDKIIFMKSVIGLKNVYYLAFHIDQRSWDIVLTEKRGWRRSPDFHHHFLKPNPLIQLC